MIERNRKLPQSRYYLRAAKYGIKKLLEVQPMDEGFLFYTVGILASLRAVQHALFNSDSKLSPQHRNVISDWQKNTRMDGREIDFIKWGRDQILKRGRSRATQPALRAAQEASPHALRMTSRTTESAERSSKEASS